MVRSLTGFQIETRIVTKAVATVCLVGLGLLGLGQWLRDEAGQGDRHRRGRRRGRGRGHRSPGRGGKGAAVGGLIGGGRGGGQRAR